jgi:hypothetical protein
MGKWHPPVLHAIGKAEKYQVACSVCVCKHGGVCEFEDYHKICLVFIDMIRPKFYLVNDFSTNHDCSYYGVAGRRGHGKLPRLILALRSKQSFVVTVALSARPRLDNK